MPFVFIYCFLYIAFYFITLLIQFWFLLFWHTVIIIYILILVLIVITINFYVLLLLLYIFFCSVINIIVPCIINVIYFNLSHFNSYCSCYYDFCLCVACGVYGSLFSYYRLYHHCHHHNHFIFLNTASHWGRFSNWIRAAWSTPTHWLLWVSRRVSINFTFIFILWCHHWGVDALFHIYHMTSFNYDAKGARDVGLSCRCHLSNSQIASSVQNMLERITCLWLCVSVLFVHLFFSFLLVFFFVFF